MRTPIRSTVYLILLALLVLGVAGSAMATQWWSNQPQMGIRITQPVSQPYDLPIGSTMTVKGNAPDADTLYQDGIIIGAENALVTVSCEWGPIATYDEFTFTRNYGAPLAETLHLTASDLVSRVDDGPDPQTTVSIHWLDITSVGCGGTPQLRNLYVDACPDGTHMHPYYISWAYSTDQGATWISTTPSVSGARSTIRVSVGWESGTIHVNNNTSYMVRACMMGSANTYEYKRFDVGIANIGDPYD